MAKALNLVEQRLMTDEEATTAAGLVGWSFWFSPVVFSLTPLVLLVLVNDGLLKLIFALTLGSTAVALWVNRLRNYRRFRRDLACRVVAIVDGAVEAVTVDQSGMTYVQVDGVVIRVPNNVYNDVREGTTVRVVYLPQTRFAVRLTIRYGIGPLTLPSAQVD